jgi:hypothetical protein
MLSSTRSERETARVDAGGSVVHLMLASGESLRIETGALDASLVCALLAELRR